VRDLGSLLGWGFVEVTSSTEGGLDMVIKELKAAGDGAAASLHPFCGGMPVDTAWKYLTNYVEKVQAKLTTTS